MRAIPEALVLEDDPTQLAELAEAVSELGYDIVTARSAVDARRRLEQRGAQVLPTIGIVDWNMDMSPDQSVGIPDFLRWLRRFAPSCTVIVYTVRADLLPVHTKVRDADPWAYLQDKRDGVDSLTSRLRTMISVRIKDLVLEGSQVHSATTGKSFTHHVAMNLLLHYPEPLDLRRSVSSVRAAYRFKLWLAEQHSPLDIEVVHKHFRLVERREYQAAAS